MVSQYLDAFIRRALSCDGVISRMDVDFSVELGAVPTVNTKYSWRELLFVLKCLGLGNKERAMKLIATMLFIWCSLSLSAQNDRCVPSTTAYTPDVKSAVALGPGWSVSWTDKHINRLGDGAAVVLIRMGAPKNLETQKQVEAALHVLTLAFQCPRCITDDENRSTAVTMMLLDALSARSGDTTLRKKIADTRKYVTEYASETQ